MNDIEINKRKAKDISIIVNGILKEMTTPPIGVYLVGGQGRGEGSWYEDNNKKPCPYNDYDIAVISDVPIKQPRLNSLRKELAKIINIHWVDIDFYSTRSLKHLKPTIHNIDLLDASTLIWGSDVLRNVPRLQIDKIGTYDLEVIYRTRIWTLLGSWVGPFHALKGEDARFFKNQMAKCILSVCDMVLIKKKSYRTSYKERAQRAIDYYPEFQLLKKLVSWAIQEKLRPTDNSLTKEEMISLYDSCKSLFIWGWRESMGVKSKYYLEPHKYKKPNLTFKQRIIRLYSIIRTQRCTFKKQDQIFRAQNLVLHSYNHGVINNSYLIEAAKILKKWGYGEYNNWEDLHYIAAEARNSI